MKSRKTAISIMIVMAMIISLSAQAITMTNSEIKYPTFPWRNYTLNLAIFSDEYDEIQNDKDDVNIVLKFESLSGDVALSDIETYSKEFYLRDSEGVEHGPVSRRMRGVSFEGGKFSIQEKQKGFELLYKLKEGSWQDKLDLLVGEKGLTERIIVRILPRTVEVGDTAKSASVDEKIKSSDETTADTAEKPANDTLLPGLTRVAADDKSFEQGTELAKKYGVKYEETDRFYTPKSPQPLNAYIVTHSLCQLGITNDDMYYVSEKGLLPQITNELTKWANDIMDESQGAIRFVGNPDDADILVTVQQSFPYYGTYRGGGITSRGYSCHLALFATKLTPPYNSTMLYMENNPGQTVMLTGTEKFWLRAPSLPGSDELIQFTNHIISWYGFDKRAGDSDDVINTVQEALINRGLLEEASGILDDNTVEAIKKLQLAKGINADGKLNRETIIALYYDEDK
ncbi:MAG: peptidoglycan-binding protein [Christensenellaceae bacterium]|nr:peptidoglycan-binding protein [Christensenellaceae bacterium]